MIHCRLTVQIPDIKKTLDTVLFLKSKQVCVCVCVCVVCSVYVRMYACVCVF